MINIIHYISILIELVIAVIGILIFLENKKFYGLGFFITFGIYVFYDIARVLEFSISISVLYIFFFIASISALVSIWQIYKLKDKE